MATRTTRSYSLLIADDDRGCRESLRDIFSSEGFRTFLAESGEEALDIVRSESIHVALFDMHMPRLTGLETLKIVRQLNALLPCILVTADASEGLRRQAFFAQAYSVVPKPVNKNIILYTVVRALKRVPDSPTENGSVAKEPSVSFPVEENSQDERRSAE